MAGTISASVLRLPRAKATAKSVGFSASQFAGQSLSIARKPAAAAARPALVQAKLKLKTRKAAAKRFKLTGSGLLVRRHSCKQHLNTKKPRSRLLRLKNNSLVEDGDVRSIIRELPYAKIVKPRAARLRVGLAELEAAFAAWKVAEQQETEGAAEQNEASQ
eukprot:jgi/Chlat1/5021/Chrsp32S04990